MRGILAALALVAAMAVAAPAHATVGTVTYDEWHSFALNDSFDKVRDKCDCAPDLLTTYTGPAGNFHAVYGYRGNDGTIRAHVDFRLGDRWYAADSWWRNDAGTWVQDF